MNKRTIGIVTVGRSDYGLCIPIMRKILSYSDLALSIYVTGAHLLHKFGNTVEDIRRDGFPIAKVVPADYSGDGPVQVGSAMGAITAGFAQVFSKEQPNILLVIGDRFETHAAALAAIPFRIPVAHIHGGELTYGAIDEYFRHSLTKLSSLHFAAHEIYARRIVQMGEEPWRVIVSGAPRLDEILGGPRLSRKKLEEHYYLDLSRPTLLVTFHPVTAEYERGEHHVHNLIQALDTLENVNIVLTYPNADSGHEVIIAELEALARSNSRVRVVKNFGPQGYVSMMAQAVAMVGNSSSGIIEAASFRLPVVNIGTRQAGRVRPLNVIDVDYETVEIIAGIKKALSEPFRATLSNLANPYGDGKASERIVNSLKEINLTKLRNKRFYEN